MDTPDGSRCVVIDGGGKFYKGRRPLLEFLTGRGINTIDLLILTHLHQDHFGGFVHLVDKIAVREAVAPCGDLQFADCVYPVFGTQEYYREYHKFFQYLERSGAKLLSSIECAKRMFRFGDYMLECLYPLKNSTMRSVVYAMALCDQNLTEESMKWALDIHKQTCNEDSSIWLLKRNEEDLALFAGDSTDETLRAALCGHIITPHLQKLSHHGINSRYFSEYVQKILKPQILVVSVDEKNYNEDMNTQIAALCAAGKSNAHYTFQGDLTIQI